MKSCTNPNETAQEEVQQKAWTCDELIPNDLRYSLGLSDLWEILIRDSLYLGMSVSSTAVNSSMVVFIQFRS